jgi:AcrR family transcriptional regulator
MMADKENNGVKKRQNAEVRKPDIVCNFYQVLREQGLEGASIGKVAKRMNIHPSLIIHYFQNKDNLILALVDHIIHEAGAIFKKLSMQTGDPGKRLRNLAAIFFSDEWYRMTDIGTDFAVLSLSRRNGLVDVKLRDMYALLKKLIMNELRTVIDAGGISIRDPERAAEIIITMYEGYRHFKHFFVNDVDADNFKNEMLNCIMAALQE